MADHTRNFRISLGWLGRRLSRLALQFVGRPTFRIGLVVVVLAVISSLLLWLVEHTPPPTWDGPAAWPYKSLWGTLRQVLILVFSGYDVTPPARPHGYALAMLCMFLGIALGVTITADIASLLVSVAMAGAGHRRIRASDHVVICGWHYTTRVLVEQLTDRETCPRCEIIIVDEEAAKQPVYDPAVHFVQGDPTEVRSLRRASTEKAHTTIIPIDWKVPEPLQDSRTTLAVMAVKSLDSGTYTCAEIRSSRNRRHIERTGVDEVVCLGELSQRLLSQAARNHGLARLIQSLLTFKHGSSIFRVPMPARFAGREFRWLLRQLNKKRGAILVSVERKATVPGDPPTLHTNPQGEFLLEEDDQLFVVATDYPQGIESIIDDG
jgi:voltage-gated potassium channel